MNSKENLQFNVMMAARDQGIANVLFRNVVGRKLGLNVADNECLSFLTIKGGIATPKEIAGYTGLTTGSTTAMLDRLERAGLIKRKPNPEDRRGVFVEVSKRWGEIAGPIVAGIQQSQRELITSYSDDELKVVADFLTRFTNNVNAHIASIEKQAE